MPIYQRFICPNPDCGQKYEMKAQWVRPRAYCDKCGCIFQLPGNPPLVFRGAENWETIIRYVGKN